MGVRWVCPTCGKGANGPERPRANATVRFCLGCSAASATLVERHAPALERRRAARSAASAERRKRKAATAAEREAARWTVDGVDLVREAHRLWNLQALRDGLGWRPRVPPITLRRTDRHDDAGGLAHYGRGITLTVGRRCTAARAVALLLHELVHMADDNSERHHGAAFHRRLMAAAREAWPTLVFGFHTIRPGGDAYAPDTLIRSALAEHYHQED